MKRHEENGQVYYTFEPHEQQERIEFERSASDDRQTVNDLMEALLNAMEKRRVEKAKAWEAIKDALQPEDRDRELTYNYIAKRLYLNDQEL